MNDGLITDTVLHWGEMGLKGLSESVFIIITYIFYIPMSFLIPSTSGLASATMGIIGPMGKFAGVDGSVVITAYLGSIRLGKLDYANFRCWGWGPWPLRTSTLAWWKWIAKLMIYLFVVTSVFLGVLAIL